MKLSVVVPFFNEAGSLPRIETELVPVLDGLGVEYEVLAVDDGSRDGSAGIVEGLQKRLPRLRLASHPENRGLGAAVRTGFAESSGDVIVTFEADFTYPPIQIAKLIIRHLETGADCVASTTVGTSTAPWLRRIGSELVNRGYRLWAGPYSSWTPLFRLYRASAVRGLEFRSDGFEANAEILIALARSGKKIVEVPVQLTVRTEGHSKMILLRDLTAHAALTLRSLLR